MKPPRARGTKNPAGDTPVEATAHADKRANIPTGELRDFVAADEVAPAKLLYPRDLSRDPQLVWKGKDDQDRADLTVPAVPIYIQEKIVPKAIIEDLRRTSTAAVEAQAALFNDFDGLEFEELVDFYHHEANWSNRLILGDSLLVMASLADKEGLKGKVQMIYLDPPYGIGFGSNWQVSTRKREVADGKAEDATRQPEQIKAFRDTWELGINSYLSYLRDRLVLARELLTDTGSVFVQIGDENVHLVRAVLDEVFGRENFCSLITYGKTTTTTGRLLPGTVDYLLWYAKDAERVKYRALYRAKAVGGQGASAYTLVQLPDGTRRRLTTSERADPASLPEGSRLCRLGDLTSPRVREARTGYYPVKFEGRTFLPGKGEWKTHPDGMARLLAADRIGAAGNTLSYVRYIEDFPAFPLTNSWDDTTVAGFGDPKTYVVQTNTKVTARCLLMTTDPGDLVLDPTCGSGTTAYVAEEWGRRWIAIDTSRVAAALARQRLMAARYPYYVLADSPEGRAREEELTGQPVPAAPTGDDIRKGFVYRRVPHVTLKAIANNPEIKEGMSRSEIDGVIARHAEVEILVDQPYETRKKVRVTGRFTVESLSPHRVLEDDVERPTTELGATNAPEAHQYETTVLDNLRKAGVQNSRRAERLVFDRLETFAGRWINGDGEFTDVDGTARRVAVSLGPEHGTVGPEQVKEAAKEAVKGTGFDLLLVCGFAFDAVADETAKEFAPSTDGFAVAAAEKKFGRLPVLLVRMNPDLAMGDELLKKTGAGNLFTVFGEPDVAIDVKDDQVTVEVRGVDVYDPTTGQVRSSSTDDIACWFVDTDYNGESFFVRHAYFTGAGDPYDRLKRALRAEIDEAAWATLYSTISRSFRIPSTGTLAVKIINHYGDEVMKVYEVVATA